MRVHWPTIAALAAAFLVLILPGTASLPLLDRDEPRFAEASREMLERGDFALMFLNNQPRYDKPPLIYWGQAAAYRLLGESDFAARLPSILATLATTAAILFFASRLYDGKTAVLAALVFCSSLQVMIHGRLALADMMMVLWVAVAAIAGWEWVSKPGPSLPRAGWGLLFFGSLALAFLAKGPIGWLPILQVAWWRRKAPIQPPLWQWAAGLAFTTLLVLAWAWPALLRSHGDVFNVGFGHHVWKRSVSPLEGHGAKSAASYLLTLPFYAATFFFSFFPWAIKFPRLALNRWRTGSSLDDSERFLLLGVVPVFVIFTLVRTKLPHYILPAMPFLAIWLSHRWLIERRSMRWPGLAAGGMACLSLLVGLVFAPMLRRESPAIRLAELAAPRLTPDMEFASTEFVEPSLVWTFRAHTRRFHQSLNAEELAGFMARPGSRFCVLPSAEVGRLFPGMPEDWGTFRAAGWNLAKGRRMDLTLLLKP